MAQIRSRINLGAKIFPFISRDWGRTVIVKQYDNDFNRQIYSSEDQDKDIGIPQIYYCHNVMPHAQGFQSVGFSNFVAGTTETTFIAQHRISDAHGNVALLGICSNGKWFIRETGHDTNWRLVRTSSNPANTVFTAYCSGVTYIYARGDGCFIYDFTGGTHTLSSQILTGLDITTVTGISAGFGYLVAWSTAAAAGGITVGDGTSGSNFIKYDSGVFANVGDILSGTNLPAGDTVTGYHTTLAGITSYVMSGANTGSFTNESISIGSVFPGGFFWSSTIDPTDFTPSLITGAGGGEIEGAEGPIVFVFPHVKGFLIYCGDNIVAAPFSANPRFPFDFQAIPGSGGVDNVSMVTQEPKDNQHYAYTSSGLQLVTMLGSNIVFPEVMDFLSGSIFEDFNDTTQTFSYTEVAVGSPILKRIKSVLNRYLVISYGLTSYTHALIYDQIMKRWGKIKFTHVDVVEIDNNLFPGFDVKQCFAFMVNDGSLWYVNFDEQYANSNGTILLGKYQFERARNLILDQIDIESVLSPNKFTLTVFTSLDGKNVSSTQNPYLAYSNSPELNYQCRAEGVNHSLLCQGKFKLTSGVLYFHLGGKI